MNFPITDKLLREAKEFELRSSCTHCFYFVGDRCAHEWPDRGQGRWPLDAPNPDGSAPTDAAFCKEFELA